MKIFKVLTVFGLVLFLCFSIFGVAKADGGIFVPKDFSGYETGQRAFIYYTGGQETMVVSANFRGNAKDFSWVIPVPAKPEIDTAGANLFTNLEQITSVSHTSSSLSLGLSGASAPQSSGVQVVEQKKVDVFDTAVLQATDVNALANYLKDHGYTFPTDKSQELKSYVDGGWYFVVAKIQPDLTAQADLSLLKGTLTPLKLTFATNKIIYPMKLTGIALRSALPVATEATTATLTPGTISETVSLDMPIDLYVLSTSSVKNNSLETDYANWLSSSNLEKINTSLGANKIVTGQKLFLTKMSATIAADKIGDDFAIENDSNNTIVPVESTAGGGFWLANIVFLIVVPLMIVFYPVPLGLIFIIFLLIQRRAKRKWLHIIGRVYEIFACLALASIGLFVVIVNRSDLGELFATDGLIGGTIGFLAIFALAILLTIKMFKHSKVRFK